MIPFALILALLVAVVTHLVCSKTLYGRQLYATGTNPKASVISGVPVKKTIFKIFIFSGVCSAVAAVASLVPEKVQAVSVAINGRVQQKKVKNLQILTVRVTDPSGVLQVTWFNMPFLSRQLLQGSRYILRGRVVSKEGHLTMDQPRGRNAQQQMCAVAAKQLKRFCCRDGI